jgi:hypothetical protein
MPVSVSSLQINIPARALEQSDKQSNPRAALKRGAGVLYQNIVIVLVPALICVLFASPLVVPGLVLIPFIFFVRWFALSSPFPRTRVNSIILVFLLAVLWSMWRAPDPASITLTVARILGGVALLYAIVDYADHPGRLWNVAGGLVGAGAVIAVFAPFVAATSADKLVDLSFLFRPVAVGLEPSNPNMIAGALAAVLPLALALLLGKDEGKLAEVSTALNSPAKPRAGGYCIHFVGAFDLESMFVMLDLLL